MTHPLDPLSADEIRQAAALVRRDEEVGDGWRFASIELREPDKADLAALESGDLVRREALVVCWNRADGQAYRAVVSLTGDAVTSWEHLPGQQPNMTVDEWHECDEMLRAHPDVLAALARRGITDITRVLADMWAYGAAFVPERYAGRRIGWCDVWYRSSERGNPYARHLTGLHPVVDLNTMTLLEVEDSYDGGTDPEVIGRVPARPAPAAAARGGAAGDQPARRRRLRPGRQPAVLAELAAADRLQLPRGPGAAPGRLHRRRAGCGRWPTGCRSPRWWCRTGTPARTTTAGPRSTSASGAWAS